MCADVLEKRCKAIMVKRVIDMNKIEEGAGNFGELEGSGLDLRITRETKESKKETL